MEIDILLDDEIIINNKNGYYIISKNKNNEKYSVFQKYNSDEITYFIEDFETLIDSLKYVKTFIK